MLGEWILPINEWLGLPLIEMLLLAIIFIFLLVKD